MTPNADLTTLAEAVVSLYNDCHLNGIADEMTSWEHRVASEHYDAFLLAQEVIEASHNGSKGTP